MADIFISYAREDGGRVQALVSELQRAGWSVFWDRRIPAGETWRSYIGRALEQARCVVVTWSRDSIDSNWVLEEAEGARRRGRLVPVSLDEVEPPHGFREIQTADLTAWRVGQPSPQLDQLVEDLRRRLGGGATPIEGTATPTDLAPRPTGTGRSGTTPLLVGASVLAVVLAAAYVEWPRPASMTAPAPRSPSPATVPAPRAPSPATAPPPAPAPATAPVLPPKAEVRAVIDDPDGWTNVRSGPGVSSPILTKVVDGEVFTATVSRDEWWRVTTKDGVSGFMHRSRIRRLD